MGCSGSRPLMTWGQGMDFDLKEGEWYQYTVTLQGFDEYLMAMDEPGRLTGWFQLPKLDYGRNDLDDWDHHDDHNDDDWDDYWDEWEEDWDSWEDDWEKDWDGMWGNASFLSVSTLAIGTAIAGMLTI